jgi:hypothetical protein
MRVMRWRARTRAHFLFDEDRVVAELDLISARDGRLALDLTAVDQYAVVRIEVAQLVDAADAHELNVTPRNVAFRQPDRVALFAPDRDFVAQERHYGRRTLVIRDDEPNHWSECYAPPCACQIAMQRASWTWRAWWAR